MKCLQIKKKFQSHTTRDEEYDDKLRDLYNFWRLEMSKQMKKWSGVKFKKNGPVSVLQPDSYI